MAELTRHLRDGVYVIDTQYVSSDVAACYLVVREGEVAVVETGTNDTTPILLKALKELQLTPDQVKYVILTHVHLDHAGGAGSLMEALPNAKLLVHQRGARHMMDPSKLQQGAMAVYGEENFKRLYGELIPVAESRVVAVNDDDEFLLGGRTLKCLDTPGHAKHHMCIWDAVSNSYFTGDTFGLAYESLETPNGRFIIPTTTPVQFDPQAMKLSLRRLIENKPEGMFLTHYGYIKNPEVAAQALLKQVDAMVDFAKEWQGIGKVELAELEVKLMEYYWGNYQTLGGALAYEEFAQILDMDVRLNAQGLEVWLRH